MKKMLLNSDEKQLLMLLFTFLLQIHRASILCGTKPKHDNLTDTVTGLPTSDQVAESKFLDGPRLQQQDGIIANIDLTLLDTTNQTLENPVLFLRKMNKLLFINPGFSTHVSSIGQLLDVVAASQVAAPVKLQNAVHPRELEWREMKLDLTKLPNVYLRLSKSRLTCMLVQVVKHWFDTKSHVRMQFALSNILELWESNNKMQFCFTS